MNIINTARRLSNAVTSPNTDGIKRQQSDESNNLGISSVQKYHFTALKDREKKNEKP
jgi:hypothetical protein